MPRIIVSVSGYDGCVYSVKSDIPYPARAIVVECGDPSFDTEGAVQKYQVDHGGFHEHLWQTEPQAAAPPKLNPRVADLIHNWSIYEEGRKQQMMAAGFIDGYLASHAELVQYLTELAQEDGPTANVVFRAMAPLLETQDENYDRLSGELNQPAIFDESAKLDGDTPVAFQRADSSTVTLIQGLLGPLLVQYPGVDITAEESSKVLSYLKLVGLSIAVDLRSGALYSIPCNAPSLAPATPTSLEYAVGEALGLCDHEIETQRDGRLVGALSMDRKHLLSLTKKIEKSKESKHEAAI